MTLDLRLRNGLTIHDTEKMVGRLLTDDERSCTLTGPARVRKPDGSLLCVYLPRILAEPLTAAWDVLSAIRQETDNRGPASASPQFVRGAGRKRTRSNPVKSAILGSFDNNSGMMAGTCRLTAFTAQNLPSMAAITPILQRMDALFREHVGDRYQAQAEYAERTHEEWLIPGTVYTTITINNTYPTGVHTDKGDLDAGFSCLAVARPNSSYEGGVLTFPRYRVGVDLQHGDLLLMDAHEYHGNTKMLCRWCHSELYSPGHTCESPIGHDTAAYGSPERVSIVAYYRTRIEKCDTAEAEQAKRAAKRETNNRRSLGIES